MLDVILEHVADHSWSVLETGAGLSTLLFLAAGAERVVSIAPDPELGERITQQIAELGLDGDRLQFIPERSELALPRLEGTYDVVLIDGGHGWPTVFVDFAYGNALLARGGLLLIDDTQLHSVGELYRMLREQPGFRHVRMAGKLQAFVKEAVNPWLPNFRGQPYIMRMGRHKGPSSSLRRYWRSVRARWVPRSARSGNAEDGRMG
jgi:precorrin-6B methylase 2